jgi:hypothetical protein
MKIKLFLIAALVAAFAFTSCSEDNTVNENGKENENPLVGTWEWILKENISNNEITPADNKTILNIFALDTILDSEQKYAVTYEVFSADTLFRKGVSPIYAIDSMTKRSWIYLPYVEMRSCDFSFVSHNNKVSEDTLCFIGNSYKIYYSRIK